MSAPLVDETLRAPLETLAGRDPDIARHYQACGLPPRRGHRPGFAGLMHIIVAQQVSAASARAIIERLDEAAQPLTPENFLSLNEDTLKTIGFSRQKMRYGRTLAGEVLTGGLDLEGMAAMEDEAAIEHLVRIKGIGRWTAEVYLLFALRRPDIWPAGDLAVQVAAQKLKNLAARPSLKEMQEIAAPWRPYRSAAARFLWHLYRHPGVPEGESI